MSESKNELVEVQIESVEGEYLTGREYIDLKVSQYKEQAEEQKKFVNDLMAKHKKSNQDIVKARMAAFSPKI
ncbi:hypothetical protein R4514_05230 [Acinetobacter baumannii]|nr:hypothetical protein [Acinetobacter baumannii]